MKRISNAIVFFTIISLLACYIFISPQLLQENRQEGRRELLDSMESIDNGDGTPILKDTDDLSGTPVFSCQGTAAEKYNIDPEMRGAYIRDGTVTSVDGLYRSEERAVAGSITGKYYKGVGYG